MKKIAYCAWFLLVLSGCADLPSADKPSILGRETSVTHLHTGVCLKTEELRVLAIR
jgi:hypothetical protein